MSKLALALSLALTTSALAEPPRGPPPEERARVEKKMRMLRVVDLADRLDLDEKAALKLSETMDRFAEKRQKMHQEMEKHREVVERAAQGDSDALKGLDGAVRQFLDLRKRMGDVDLEEWIALGQGLSAQKQARLALFLAEWPRFVQKMMREAHRERRGEMRRMHRGDEEDD